MKTQVLVAIPTYNERENIEPLLNLFKDVPGDFHILFVDDNSPDGTSDLVEELQKDRPYLLLLKRPGKLGLGSAHRDAIHYAYDNGYSLLATMDADLTHNPDRLVKMLELVKYGDVIVGSRYVLDNSLPGWNFMRRSLTRVGHFVTCFFLKMPYDATGALRVYNLSKIPRPLFGLVRSNGYSFLYESLFMLWTNGCRVLEVPIELPARTYGSSKMSFEQILVSVFRLVLLYTNIRVTPDLYRVKEAEEPLAWSQGTTPWDQFWSGLTKETAPYLLLEIYETWLTALFNKPLLERVLRKHFRPGEKVLHAGCGSGQVDRVTRHWLEITACDIAGGALKRYGQFNWPYCELTQSNLTALPYDEGSFDGVYSLGVMEYLSAQDCMEALREAHRVLRPGGRLVILWSRSVSPDRLFRRTFHAFARRWEKNGEGGSYPAAVSLLKNLARPLEWFDQAGFRIVTCETSWRDLRTSTVFVAEKI